MNLVVLCDFDGTITKIDIAEFILAKFAKGDWRVFDAQFVNGEITLEECLREQFSLVIASRGDILKELENVVTFRPHFDKLAEYCRTNRLPLTIVSAGLDFVIDPFLKLKGWHKLVETYIPKTKFVANSIQFTFPRLVYKTSASFKQDLVRQCKGQGKKIAYIGDGSGDYAAAKYADYPFAVKGSRLARLCESNRAYYKDITDFQEVVEAISKIAM